MSRSQRWPNAFFKKLRAARHVQQHLATHRHWIVLRVEQDRANLFADFRAARLANFGDRNVPVALHPIRKHPELRALAGAVRSIEHHESPTEIAIPVNPRWGR